ncbi:hypothetical protein BC781_101377 [Sediminitomix flava]|uniref:Uncharacterized protein n=1 Tax=Sediminitomix flava TaxID=379075 RepID=A0A316A2U2_SEDFL|nr:hypothetical protein BC781_101377 [Sediminitomix flava]
MFGGYYGSSSSKVHLNRISVKEKKLTPVGASLFNELIYILIFSEFNYLFAWNSQESP